MTDIAARGIDVDGVTHVMNFELPNVPESYVHSIGRTAHAGAAGVAISFCNREERACLRDIERLAKCPVAIADAPSANGAAPPPTAASSSPPDGEVGFAAGVGSRAPSGAATGSPRTAIGEPHARPRSDRPAADPAGVSDKRRGGETPPFHGVR